MSVCLQIKGHLESDPSLPHGHFLLQKGLPLKKVYKKREKKKMLERRVVVWVEKYVVWKGGMFTTKTRQTSAPTEIHVR